MSAPAAYPTDYAPSTYEPEAEDEFGAGTCDECDTRIRSHVQRGEDTCLQCREGER
jgi:hypothetical protein